MNKNFDIKQSIQKLNVYMTKKAYITMYKESNETPEAKC